MNIAGMLKQELEQEQAATRRLLERVPEDKFDWKPHEKSMTMQRLASHVAELPSWAHDMVKLDAWDFSPPDGEPYVAPNFSSVAEMLAEFDKNMEAAKEIFGEASDEDLFKPWSLLNGGQEVFTAPRIGVIRQTLMNHIVHHRAQLGVYLRLCDVPVPQTIGPTADEAMF